METSEAPSGSAALEAALLAARKSPEQWRMIIEARRASGLSVRTFCTRHGISQSKFYYWAKRLGLSQGPGPKPPPPARFALIKAVQQPASPRPLPPGDAGLELRLASSRGSRVVLVRPGFDRQTLVELLAALEGLA
jgi:hypothetical protein